jgi:hypothetical protein
MFKTKQLLHWVGYLAGLCNMGDRRSAQLSMKLTVVSTKTMLLPIAHIGLLTWGWI